MTTRVLLVGINPYDSGKTTLAINLARVAQKRGIQTEYFKPLSGHNYWYKHNHTRRCIDEGVLYSYDYYGIRDAVKSEAPPLVINPFHSLFAPLKMEKPGDLISNTLALGGWSSVLVIERVTTFEGGTPTAKSLVSTELLDKGEILVPRIEIQAMTRNTKVIDVNSLEETQDFENRVIDSTLEKSLDILEQDTSLVIIESFNDSALPWKGLERVDHVLAVGPGHIFAYDPRKFLNSVDFRHKEHQPVRAVTHSSITDLLRPFERLFLQPGKAIELKDFRKLGLFQKE